MRLLAGLAFISLPSCATTAFAAETPSEGWTCSTVLEIDGYRASMSRHFENPYAKPVYLIQTRKDRDHPYGTTWKIDSRADGPPADEPVTWDSGRSEAEVLRDGPDYVSIGFPWRTKVTGPVWAFYYADGKPVGSEMLFTARKVRRLSEKDGTMGGLQGGLSKGPIMSALNGARYWSVVVVDVTGKRLVDKTFSPPDLGSSIETYRAKRAEIEELEAEFRTDFKPRQRGDTRCEVLDNTPVL